MVRICVAYDCLYPWTVGGAERWYRALAERLAAAGHEVTYITRRQWPEGEFPSIKGVRVIAVSREEPLYGPDGKRRIGEAIRFGLGVLRHLARRGNDYDIVHTCSFPYFSVLAAAAVRPFRGFTLVVDWFEVWSPGYWREYLGGPAGWVGQIVQRCCARVPQEAQCFSVRHAERLREERVRSAPRIIGGLYGGPRERPGGAEPAGAHEVIAVGRQIPEKNVPAVVEAIAMARKKDPGITGLIIGDGPDHEAVSKRISELGIEGSVSAPGFVDAPELEAAMAQAACLVHPSVREGYGLVVVEAASCGTPVIVVDHPDNASVELVASGVNGFVAASAEPAVLADAILEVVAAGPEMRRSTLEWFTANFDRLSIDRTLDEVVGAYASSAASAQAASTRS